MSERIRIGYIHEFHPNFENNSWIADEDLTSDNPVVQKDVQEWLQGLAHPWSETAISFLVTPTIAVNEEIPEEKTWTAKYISTYYDCLQSIAIAYGITPNAAIENVVAMVKEVVEKHYKPNEDDEESSSSPILSREFAEIFNIFY